jgi:cystathionine beta-lyase
MTFDFDTYYDRRHSDSDKWNHYPGDILPLWVADMDFRSPGPVIQALRDRVDHGIFGYGRDPVELRQVVVARLEARYGWRIAPDAVVFVPGVVQGFNLVCKAFCQPGDGVLVQPPVYPPILQAHTHAGLVNNEAQLVCNPDGSYGIDLDVFEHAITDQTRLFILCNPHNPVGRAFRRDELEAMAEICLRRNILICSDEIHSDIIYNGHRHIPIASIAPEIEQKTITLISPSKTFNIAGLRLAVAVIPNPELRKAYVALQRPLAGGPGILAVTAALAAYRDGETWLQALLAYLEANRDFLVDYVHRYLPNIGVAKPEATFLAWLDCRRAGIPLVKPYTFFMEKARVALNDGSAFGKDSEGFVRLNFGCPRAILVQALEQIRQALAQLKEV